MCHTTIHECQNFLGRCFHQLFSLGCAKESRCRCQIRLVDLFVTGQRCRIILLCKQNVTLYLHIHREFLKSNRFSDFICCPVVRPVLIRLLRIAQHVVIYQFGTIVIHIVFLLGHTQRLIHIGLYFFHRSIVFGPVHLISGTPHIAVCAIGIFGNKIIQQLGILILTNLRGNHEKEHQRFFFRIR